MKIAKLTFTIFIGLLISFCFVNQDKVWSYNENDLLAQEENVDGYIEEEEGVLKDTEKETYFQKSVVVEEGTTDVYQPSESDGDLKEQYLDTL